MSKTIDLQDPLFYPHFDPPALEKTLYEGGDGLQILARGCVGHTASMVAAW